MCDVLHLFIMARQTSIGVRELRLKLSLYLRRVEAGQTFEVTERGRPVAILAPLPGRERMLDRLISDGDARPSTRDPRTIRMPEPARAPLRTSLSQALGWLREDER